MAFFLLDRLDVLDVLDVLKGLDILYLQWLAIRFKLLALSFKL